MPSPPDPAELARLAERIAARAAALLVEGLARARVIATKSTPTDLVTEMDRASEALIVEAIRAERPGDAIVGEEGTDATGTTGVQWFVDPIDGTVNYVYGHPGFAVSIAAAYDARMVAGVVVDPLHGDTFSAVAGAGARRNGVPARVSARTDLATALVGTGFAYDPAVRARQARVLTHVLPAVRDIRRMGAASVDLCSVACGRLDAYYERNLSPWDWAAGELIAREAGARTGGLDGGPVAGDYVLAAPPALFDDLAALLVASGAAGV